MGRPALRISSQLLVGCPESETALSRGSLSSSLTLATFTFLPTYTGMPMTIAGMAMPAMREMPTGAPISVPSCQRIFFLRLHGFLPQNVQPEGLNRRKKK